MIGTVKVRFGIVGIWSGQQIIGLGIVKVLVWDYPSLVWDCQSFFGLTPDQFELGLLLFYLVRYVLRIVKV